MSLTDLINPPQERQTESYQWQVVGCSTRPMGNYLKALGLLRIIKDKIAPDAQGFWQGDSFYIQSSLTWEEIIDRILMSYEPSGISTPWNGSSGFYRKRPSFMVDILKSKCDRWNRLKNAYQICLKLTDREGLREDLKKKNKTKKYEFISQVRSAAVEESWNNWLNVVSVPKIVVDEDGKRKQEYAYPGLTGGTGGIIASKDMGYCFADAISCLWDLKTGVAKKNAKSLIESSLLGISDSKSLSYKSLLTQFYPVNDFLLDISGAKKAQEYAQAGSSTVLCNPFDAVLIYEGLLTFSGVSCRIENTKSEQTSASFSLAVDLAVGTADVTAFTEGKKRLEEIWLPLWNMPKSWNDVRSDLFNPNRRRLPNQQITDTIDFAYELSKWGNDNEIDRYIRYAFLPRKGRNSNFAIPIGEFIPKGKQSYDLAAQLRYFRRDCRHIAKDEDATYALKSAISSLEKELLKLASGNGSYLNCLIQIGVLEREISYSSILSRENTYIAALPPLSSEWIDKALDEDKSTECRLGIALASLGLRTRATKVRKSAKGKLVWVKDANLDWGRRSLVDNLITLQRCWSIDRSQNLKPIPTKLVSPSFADLDNFIRDNVSDRKIEQIALGASTCISIGREFKGGYLETLPPHYGIGAICQWGKTPEGKKIEGQGLILNALSRGQPELAMKLGLRKLRSKRLFPYLKHLCFTPNAKRIAAAMAFPLSIQQLERLINYHIKQEV